ncbi:MAG: hypothetical protein KAX19_00205, partial [Candidatus Brocadiae bacterium]|nr:hypothetical protein [Candidatus Brocadiia bacterium]
MASESVESDPLLQDPSGAEADYQSLINELESPVVLLTPQNEIYFMNPAAERLLEGGIKFRIESHLSHRPKQSRLSQVRFRRDSGADLVLKIKLSDIQWMGKPAVQATLQDVTPYIATVQQLRRD